MKVIIAFFLDMAFHMPHHPIKWWQSPTFNDFAFLTHVFFFLGFFPPFLDLFLLSSPSLIPDFRWESHGIPEKFFLIQIFIFQIRRMRLGLTSVRISSFTLKKWVDLLWSDQVQESQVVFLFIMPQSILPSDFPLWFPSILLSFPFLDSF